MSGKDLRVVRNDAASRYEAHLDGEVVGVLTFVRTPEAVDLEHTVVEREHRGQGIGERLAEAALDDARESGGQVIPTCPFVADYIRDHPEHEDLVAA